MTPAHKKLTGLCSRTTFLPKRVLRLHDSFWEECWKYLDGFKKSIRTQHVEKFSIVSGNATPAPPKNLPPPGSISILKMEEDSWGVWGWGYRAGRRKKKLNHGAMLNFSTLRVLMNFLNPSWNIKNARASGGVLRWIGTFVCLFVCLFLERERERESEEGMRLGVCCFVPLVPVARA